MTSYKPSQSKNIDDFFGRGIEAKILADKHFPNECPERLLLLDIENIFTNLWKLQNGLKQTRDKIARIRSLKLPHDRDVFALAFHLEDLAECFDKGTPAEQNIRRASEMLQAWHELNYDLEKLHEVSAALPLGTGNPESQS